MVCLQKFNEDPVECMTREEKVVAGKITWEKGLTPEEKTLFKELVIITTTRGMLERGRGIKKLSREEIAVLSPSHWQQVVDQVTQNEKMCVADAMNGLIGFHVNDHVQQLLNRYPEAMALWKEKVVKPHAKEWTFKQYFDRIEAYRKTAHRQGSTPADVLIHQLQNVVVDDDDL